MISLAAASAVWRKKVAILNVAGKNVCLVGGEIDVFRLKAKP